MLGLASFLISILQLCIGYWNDASLCVNNVMIHFTHVNGLPLMFSYLFTLYKFECIPTSTHKECNLYNSFKALVMLDFLMYVAHYLEHKCKSSYHKVHHKHIHPKWYNSFEVHIIDALVMIFIPLSMTLYCVILTNYELLIFGAFVSSHLTILHSNNIPFETTLSKLHIGTPSFHKKHHLHFQKNFGHIFTLWDKCFNTFI